MKKYSPIIYAILAAALFGLNAPISKLLLQKISPVLMASLLYFGAGIGMLLISYCKKPSHNKEEPLNRKQMPYIILMILLDIVAPILLMMGIKLSSAANAALINNFEIVATSLIALLIFKETISRRLWFGIILITLSSFLLSIEDINSFTISFGSILVILACISWGLENNCTKKLSTSDPLQIVIIKGLASGLGSLIVAIIFSQLDFTWKYLLFALILGSISYGLSIYFYVLAQRYLGAAKTSAFYAFAPFIGAVLSMIIFKSTINYLFIIGFILMIIGSFFASIDFKEEQRR